MRRQREAEAAATPSEGSPVAGVDIDAVFAKIDSAAQSLGRDVEQACALDLDATHRAGLRTLLLRTINRLGELGLAIEL